MALIQQIIVPLIAVNDTTLTIAEISVENGTQIKIGDLIMVFETSKTTYEIHAENDGFIKILAEVNADYEVNSIVAEVFSTKEETIKGSKELQHEEIKKNDFSNTSNPQSHLTKTLFVGTAIFSNSAKQLLETLNADISFFEGWDMVTKADVETFFIKGKAKDIKTTTKKTTKNIEVLPIATIAQPLSSNKKREIEFLTSVQQTGLTSTIYINIDTTTIFTYLNKHLKYFKNSLLPLIVYEASRLLEKYKLLNAFYFEENIYFYDSINMGFAIDIDKGLKVVKIENSNQKTIFEIENQIFNLSEKYIDDKLVVEDLTNITFTITDLSGEGIHFFKPLVNKYNSAILGVSSIDNKSKFQNLSLTFDHRVTEGKLGAAFLSELKQRLESYSYTDLENVRPDITCYKCMKTLGDDLSGLGMIPCITTKGKDGYICSTCWSGH